ncbi:MAG: FG-GAP repeat domain-containing protein [Thermoplasmatota archaeon]
MRMAIWVGPLVAVALMASGCIDVACRHQVSFTFQPLLKADQLEGGYSDTSNIQVADLDRDGNRTIIATLPLHHEIAILRGCPDACRTQFLVGAAYDLVEPVRAEVVDFNHDGINDLLVADIGLLYPSDELVGSVVLELGQPGGGYVPHVLLHGVGRVSCAEPADLGGDGDLDIAVCIFGNAQGSLEWLEQTTPLNFTRHLIDARPGSINAYPVDINGDGHLDIVQSLAQLSEEVNVWVNDGHGHFTQDRVAKSNDTFYGSSGAVVTDLDRDGRPDILALHGDVYDNDLPPQIDPGQYHGMFWLHNEGGNPPRFTRHDLAHAWGLYGAGAVDLNGDGQTDIVASTFQMHGYFPGRGTASLFWLENYHGTFVRHDIPGAPQQLITLAVTDLRKDGNPDILVGSHFPDQSSSPDAVPVDLVVPHLGGCSAAVETTTLPPYGVPVPGQPFFPTAGPPVPPMPTGPYGPTSS